VLLVLVLVLVLAGGSFFYFSTANNLNRESRGPLTLPPQTLSRQTYTTARQKLNRFLADPAERGVTFSNPEVNALLIDSPEFRIFTRGTVVALSQNAAEVSCSWPVELPFLPRRYLNCGFQVRPSMRGGEIELDLSRIERDGKPVGPAETRQYQAVIAPLVAKALSGWNKIQGDRGVREARVDNGNLILAR
jgi:hypothetical protein